MRRNLEPTELNPGTWLRLDPARRKHERPAFCGTSHYIELFDPEGTRIELWSQTL